MTQAPIRRRPGTPCVEGEGRGARELHYQYNTTCLTGLLCIPQGPAIERALGTLGSSKEEGGRGRILRSRIARRKSPPGACETPCTLYTSPLIQPPSVPVEKTDSRGNDSVSTWELQAGGQAGGGTVCEITTFWATRSGIPPPLQIPIAAPGPSHSWRICKPLCLLVQY